MSMKSSDWAQIWAPLAGELVRALFGVIFGKKHTKRKYYEIYGLRSPTAEDLGYEFPKNPTQGLERTAPPWHQGRVEISEPRNEADGLSAVRYPNGFESKLPRSGD